MRLRDAAKWIKEKITGKKTEETPVLTPMIATEEDIEKAKEMDREIEEMEKKSAPMAPIVTSQAEMERLQRFEADSKQIAEMAGKPHEEVAEAILKVTTETPASLEEATQQVHERMELQAEVAAETKEDRRRRVTAFQLKGEKEGEEMRLRDAAKWIKEKITGKKTEETPVLTPMIATEEDIEKAKEMDREIEEMEKKSAPMAPIVTSQAEMERLQRFEADSKQIAEMAGKPHEEVAEAILKVTTETPASLEEATQQVHERMELQAEVAAETKEESDTPFVQRWAEAKGMTVQELEQETGWTAEQLEQNIIDSSRIITTELVKAQRLMKILMTNNGRRRKGIPMVRRQQLLRAERNQRRRRSENRKES